LGVSLLSARKLCKLLPDKTKGEFDTEVISLYCNQKRILKAVQNDGLYIVKHISKWFNRADTSQKGTVRRSHEMVLTVQNNPEITIDEDLNQSQQPLRTNVENIA